MRPTSAFRDGQLPQAGQRGVFRGHIAAGQGDHTVGHTLRGKYQSGQLRLKHRLTQSLTGEPVLHRLLYGLDTMDDVSLKKEMRAYGVAEVIIDHYFEKL